MAIKDEAAFVDLKPYLKMTVAPNGVTVGDLNFVVAQTQWSTALQPILAANTIPADMSLDLWQAAQGDVGQGFTTALGRSQTSWLDSQGRLPANQVFIATSCGFQIFGRNTASTTATATEALLDKTQAVHAIGRNLTWEVTVGDGITRTFGALLDFGGYSGQYAIPDPATAAGFSVGTAMGSPDKHGRKLRIPLVFPPNISVRIKVRSGSSFRVPATTDGAGPLPNTVPGTPNSWLAVRQYLHGYLCTMPVG